MDDRDNIMMRNANNIRGVNETKQLISLAVDALVFKGALKGKALLNKTGVEVAGKTKTLTKTSGINLEQVVTKGQSGTTTKAAGKTKEKILFEQKSSTAEKIKGKIPTEKAGESIKKKSFSWESTKSLLKKDVKIGTSLIKEEVISGVTKKIAKEANLGEEAEALLRIRSDINKLRAWKTLTFSGEKLNADMAINSVSGLLLNSPSKTHGAFSASRWLTVDAPREHLIEKGKIAKEKLPGVTEKMEEYVNQNINILKEKNMEIPNTMNSRKEKDAFMRGKDIPDEITKNRGWKKNQEEYFVLKKQEEHLIRDIKTGERTPVNIKEEVGIMDEKTMRQVNLGDQMRTIATVEGMDELIKGKSTADIMNKDFVKSIGMSNPTDAYKLVEEFDKLEEEKQLIAQNCQDQLTEGHNYLDNAQLSATKALLKDAKKILKSANDDANEEGSEEDIKRMRKA